MPFALHDLPPEEDTAEAPTLRANMGEGTFVNDTVSQRWPTIIGKNASTFKEQRDAIHGKYGDDGVEAAKAITGLMSKLIVEVTHTRYSIPLLEDSYEDAALWNAEIERRRKRMSVNQPLSPALTYYTSAWMFAECYIYRYIFGVIYDSAIRGYDCFGAQKREQFEHDKPGIVAAASFLAQRIGAIYGEDSVEKTNAMITADLEAFIKLSLWGNVADMSLSGGEALLRCPSAPPPPSPEELAHAKAEHLVVDDVAKVTSEILAGPSSSRLVSIILDNAASELVGDLCLAEYLLASGTATKVSLHGKAFPWFVSDTTREDFDWTLTALEGMEDEAAKKLTERIRARMAEGTLTWSAHAFWTRWNTWKEMREAAPDLHEQLRSSALIIAKGDLNYRKLLRDRRWNWTESVETAIGPLGLPPILALRTNKSEVLAGVSMEVASRLAALDPTGIHREVFCTGKYAVAQLFDEERSGKKTT